MALNSGLHGQISLEYQKFVIIQTQYTKIVLDGYSLKEDCIENWHLMIKTCKCELLQSQFFEIPSDQMTISIPKTIEQLLKI